MGSQELENPLAVGSITELLAILLNVVMIIAVPIVIFFLIYAGFLYVTARGNPEQIKKAGNALLYGIIGGVIILGAFAIVAIVKNLVEAF